jgi:hypothetical protein
VPAEVANRLRGRTLVDLTLSNVDLSRTSLRNANLSGAYFANCDLRRIDWEGVLLSNTTFANCDLDEFLTRAQNASCVVRALELFGPQLMAHLSGDNSTSISGVRVSESGGLSESVDEYAIRYWRVGYRNSGAVAGWIRRSVGRHSWAGWHKRIGTSSSETCTCPKGRGRDYEDPGAAGTRPPFILTTDGELRRDVVD